MKIVILALVLVALLSGCSGPESCGDGTCDTSIGENDLSCPEDCTSFHLGCVDGSCAVVEGSGSDECLDDLECA